MWVCSKDDQLLFEGFDYEKTVLAEKSIMDYGGLWAYGHLSHPQENLLHSFHPTLNNVVGSWTRANLTRLNYFARHVRFFVDNFAHIIPNLKLQERILLTINKE